MIVYADVLFLLNFSMDYLVLHLVSRYLHKGKHLIFCALFGGFYGIGAVQIPLLGSPLFQLLFGGILVKIAFNPKSIYEFLKAFFLFLCTACLMGGLLYFILLVRGKGTMINGILYFDFSLLQFLVVTLFSWGAFSLVTVLFGQMNEMRLRNVMITNRGKTVLLSAILDTGCELIDPLTGFPVMVAEFDCVAEILSEELRGMIIEKQIGPVPEKIYQIPFSTVKEGSGLMLAFRPDNVTVFEGKKRGTFDQVLVGIVQRKLTVNQSYSALLHRAMTI